MREAQWQKAYNEKRATALRNGWTPAQTPRYMAPKPRFREDTPRMMAGGGPVMIPPPPIYEPAPAPMFSQPQAPQPVILVGPNSPPITTASTVGGTTIISTIGSRAPIGGYSGPYYPPAYPVGYGF